MATKPKADTAVKARVLFNCGFGPVNTVVTLTAEEAAAGVDAGVLSTADGEVAYAESLQAPAA